MNQVVDVMSRTNPVEMDSAELELVHEIVGLVALRAEPADTAETVRPNQRNVAHRAVANLVDQCLACR